MRTTSLPSVLVHAAPVVRSVPLGGSDEPAVRAEATARIASLLGDPPGTVLTSSCTAALDAAAAVLGIGPGDEVVVPAFTFPTTALAFANRGATLRFAEVDPATGNVDPASVADRLSPRTRAVVVMHYAGIAADLAGLSAVLAGRDVAVVEDAAHGVFASLDGVPLGRLGRLGCLSFHRTKNLSVLEGGALVVNDPSDVDRADVAVDKGTDRVAFAAGRVPAYEWAGPGAAGRMGEAGVRLLADEVPRAEAAQARRHQVWDRYIEDLTGWGLDRGVGLPVVGPGRAHPAHLFALVLPSPADRDPFVAHCAAAGIQAVRHFGSLPSSRAGRALAHRDDACLRTHDFAGRLVRIPLHQDLGESDVDRVVAAVTGWAPSRA